MQKLCRGFGPLVAYPITQFERVFMLNLHSFADAVRAQTEKRAMLAQRQSISSFNPNVVAACAQWEWDQTGPLRRRAA